MEAAWQPIRTAPFGQELELAVIDRDGAHALVFPCRRTLTGWFTAATRERIDVSPTHWREWPPMAGAEAKQAGAGKEAGAG